MRKAKLERAAASRVDEMVVANELSSDEAPAAVRRVYDQLAREAAPSSSESKVRVHDMHR